MEQPQRIPEAKPASSFVREDTTRDPQTYWDIKRQEHAELLAKRRAARSSKAGKAKRLALQLRFDQDLRERRLRERLDDRALLRMQQSGNASRPSAFFSPHVQPLLCSVQVQVQVQVRDQEWHQKILSLHKESPDAAKCPICTETDDHREDRTVTLR